MKFYVASSSKNLDTVRRAMDIIRAHGHDITNDWTRHVHAQNEGRLEVSTLSICQENILGVCEASAVIYAHTEEPSAGAWFELGLAFGKGIPVAAIVARGRVTTRNWAGGIDIVTGGFPCSESFSSPNWTAKACCWFSRPMIRLRRHER